MQHKEITEGNQHIVHNMKFTTLTERDNYTPTQEDLYKVVLVLNPFKYYSLSSINPTKWEIFGNSEVVNLDAYTKAESNALLSVKAEKRLLAEYIATANIQSVTFNNLDINTHKSYKIEAELINDTASQARISCCINGDMTLTNYYTQYTLFTDATTTGGMVNDSYFALINPSKKAIISAEVKTCDGFVNIMSNHTRDIGNNAPVPYLANITKRTTVSNVSQITISSAVSGTIKAGSKIRIYRGDM